MKNNQIVDLWQYAQKEKPDYPCVFATRWTTQNGEYDYHIYRFEIMEDDAYTYMGWLDEDGVECDDSNVCEFEEYLILSVNNYKNKGTENEI